MFPSFLNNIEVQKNKLGHNIDFFIRETFFIEIKVQVITDSSRHF